MLISVPPPGLYPVCASRSRLESGKGRGGERNSEDRTCSRIRVVVIAGLCSAGSESREKI